MPRSTRSIRLHSVWPRQRRTARTGNRQGGPAPARLDLTHRASAASTIPLLAPCSRRMQPQPSQGPAHRRRPRSQAGLAAKSRSGSRLATPTTRVNNCRRSMVSVTRKHGRTMAERGTMIRASDLGMRAERRAAPRVERVYCPVDPSAKRTGCSEHRVSGTSRCALFA